MNDTKRHGEGMLGKSATHLVSKLMCIKFQSTSQHNLEQVKAQQRHYGRLYMIRRRKNNLIDPAES